MELQCQSKPSEDDEIVSIVFHCGSTFDFFNRIGQKRTKRIRLVDGRLSPATRRARLGLAALRNMGHEQLLARTALGRLRHGTTHFDGND
jgi:hypothetical protein